MAEKAERLRVMYKIKKIFAGIITIAICASMACILSGCKSNVNESDPTYLLLGKLFDDNLPCYLNKTEFEVNEDFDNLLVEGSEKYNEYIAYETDTQDFYNEYYFKTNGSDILGGVISFPESCEVSKGRLDSFETENSILGLSYSIDIQYYVGENKMDRSETANFFDNICEQFTDALVCDYKSKINYEDGTAGDCKEEERSYITDFCEIQFNMNYKGNLIKIQVIGDLDNAPVIAKKVYRN